MRPIIHFLTILLCFFTLASLAQKPKGGSVETAGNEKNKRIFSLIIGISKYENLPKLEFADDDARAFKDYLVQVQNIPEHRVFCLVDEAATTINIFDKLYLIADSMKAHDQFVLYFSGHGDWESKISDNSLLLLQKAPKQNYLRYPDQFINSQTLNDFLKKLSEKGISTLLIADACRSGNLIGGKEGTEATVLQLRQSFKNNVRILSCMPDELSFESAKWGGGRGVFSYFLTLGLMGMGKQNVSTPLDLSLGELRNYLEENLRKETEGRQNPVFEGDSRTIVAHVDKGKLSLAKQLFVSNSNSSLTMRGKGNIDTTSTEFKSINRLFEEQLLRGNLIVPTGQSALSLYHQLLRFGPESFFDDKRHRLIEKIASNFARYSEQYYNELAYPLDDLLILRREIEAALQLSSRNPYLRNRFYSNKLFLDAGIILYDDQPTVSRVVSIPKLQQVIDTLEKAVSFSPNEPFLFRMLGNCYLPVNPTKSIAHYNTYVALLPNDAGAYNAIGVAYFQLKQYQQAAGAFKKAISKSNTTAKFYYNLGMCYREMGLEGEAARMFKKAQAVGQPESQEDF